MIAAAAAETAAPAAVAAAAVTEATAIAAPAAEPNAKGAAPAPPCAAEVSAWAETQVPVGVCTVTSQVLPSRTGLCRWRLQGAVQAVQEPLLCLVASQPSGVRDERGERGVCGPLGAVLDRRRSAPAAVLNLEG